MITRRAKSILSVVTVLASLACACGGKLVGGDGSDVTTGTSSVATCGDAAEDAGPFVGSWMCQENTVPVGPNPPGTLQGPGSGRFPLTFAETSDGGLSMTIGRGSGFAFDAGPDAAPECPSLKMTVSGTTATLDGTQACAYDIDSLVSGTFTVTGCSATISDWVATGTVYVPEPYTVTSKGSGTCTKGSP